MRELENVIEGAIALGTSTYIGRDELPLSVTLKAPEPAELGQWVTELNACKKTIIERALQKTSVNRAEAARLLDLKPQIFLCPLQRTPREVRLDYQSASPGSRVFRKIWMRIQKNLDSAVNPARRLNLIKALGSYCFATT